MRKIATSRKSTSVLMPSAAVKRAFRVAIEARKTAHAPYSGFQVGASLLTKSGRIFAGCNVENCSYGGTICAERTAIVKAVSERQVKFSDIVVVTDAAEPAFPCGFCLQVMAEFFSDDTRIWVGNPRGLKSMHSFRELVPKPFGPRQLKVAKR
jgi:cytidine deaminase